MTYAANEPLESWLAQESPEDVLEPDLPIVDPHHHLCDLRSFATEPHASFEQKVYLCEEIVNDIRESGHNVVQQFLGLEFGAPAKVLMLQAENPDALITDRLRRLVENWPDEFGSEKTLDRLLIRERDLIPLNLSRASQGRETTHRRIFTPRRFRIGSNA